MSTWWQQLSIRERAIILIAFMVMSIIGIDTLIVEQFKLSMDVTDEKLIQARDDLEWMSQAVHRLPKLNATQKQVDSGRVVTFVDSQITRLQLKSNMQQMTPIGDHSVRLRLNEIEFSRLLQFFNAINSSLVTEEARILRSDTIGYVNVSMIVSNGKKPS